jgi:hypothetical protein
MFAAERHAVDSGQSLFSLCADGCSNSVRLFTVCLEHMWWPAEMHTELWRLNLKARNSMEGLSGDGKVIQKCWAIRGVDVD